MKKRIYKYFQLVTGVVVFILMASSCEDFLNEVPGDKLTPEQHYKQGADAEISSIGAYSILQDVVPNLVILNDLRSDLLTESENFDPDLRDINRHTISIDNKYLDPSGYYRIILNTNEVLANIGNIQKYDREFDSLDLFFYTIDMVSLRSWAYFTLVRLFGEAAYIPDNMTSFDENYDFEYYSRERMIDTLISQMSDTTFSYPDAFIPNSTISIYDRALRGELYLEKGDYENAAKYLIHAIGDADIKIYKVDFYEEEDWENIHKYAISQNIENMSVVPFSYEDIQENPLADIFYADRNYLLKPSKQIVGLFNAQKSARGQIGDLSRGIDISFSYFGTDELLMVNKYSLDPVESSGSDIILYRAADIHLLLAEALNQMGQHKNALNIVNRGYKDLPGWRSSAGIRGRLNLTEREVTSADSLIAIENIIMEERAMELAFEGKRWFDLVRVANRRGESYLANRVVAKYDDPALAQQVKTKLMNKNNWYLPFRK